MTLKIGQKYKKVDFKIDKSSFRLSEIIVQGELFMFFTMDEKYKNSIEPDGLVYECRCQCSVIPKDVKAKLQPHVFIREKKGDKFEYLGKGLYETRYNEKCNKIFIKGE